MIIDKISISNFKSFDEVDIELNRFTVIIGANGAGKSNLFNAIKFLSDIVKQDIDYAASMQGGIEYIYNVNNKYKKDTKIKIYFKYEEEDTIKRNRLRFRRKREKVRILRKGLSYELIIHYYQRLTGGKRVKNIDEKIEITYDHVNNDDEKEILGNGILFIENKKNKILHHYENNTEISEDQLDNIFDMSFFEFIEKRWDKEKGIMAKYIAPFSQLIGIDSLPDVVIYDLDPKLPKSAKRIEGVNVLANDGDNLALVLENLLKNRDNRTKMYNIIVEFLPFIENYGVLKGVDRSLLSNIKERYSDSHSFPASLISEGTINITMLVIVLYFEENDYILIEEPAKRIHPKLIEILTHRMIEVSDTKQVILSTHNPQIVKYAGIDNLLLISRNESGNSIVKKPNDSSEVKEFLKSDIGLDELFIDNFLDWK